MPNRGDRYVVQVKPSHIKWGEYRNPTNRAVIQGESYVKIPAGPAPTTIMSYMSCIFLFPFPPKSWGRSAFFPLPSFFP